MNTETPLTEDLEQQKYWRVLANDIHSMKGIHSENQTFMKDIKGKEVLKRMHRKCGETSVSHYRTYRSTQMTQRMK